MLQDHKQEALMPKIWQIYLIFFCVNTLSQTLSFIFTTKNVNIWAIVYPTDQHFSPYGHTKEFLCDCFVRVHCRSK